MYEDELLLSGKKQKGKGERVVVQVDSDVSRAPQRRVELVTVVAERSKRSREGEGNESEKENMIRSKISTESRKNGESVTEKVKSRVKEREREKDLKDRDKKNAEKEESKKHKEKNVDKKSSKSHSHKESSTKKNEQRIKKEKKNTDNTQKRREEEQNPSSEMAELDAIASASLHDIDLGANMEDLSQINLPVDPEPATQDHSVASYDA